MTCALVLTGCMGNSEVYRIPIELTVNAKLPAGTVATQVHVVVYRLHTAPYVADDERLEQVVEYVTGPMPTLQKIEFPASEKDRLAVWAWADIDGDGKFCGKVGAVEPAGYRLSEPFPGAGRKPVKEFARMPGNSMVGHQFAEPVTLDIELASPCRTANQLAAEESGKQAH